MRQVWQSDAIKRLQGEFTPGQIMWGHPWLQQLRPWSSAGYVPSSSFNERDQLTTTAAAIAQLVEETLENRVNEAEEEKETNVPLYEFAQDQTESIVASTVADQVRVPQ